MAIKVMADSDGSTYYTASDIGAAFASFAAGGDYVIEGIGNQLEVVTSSDSLVATIKSGEALVCGRPVMLTGTETVTIEGNQTSGVYIVLRVDLGRPIGSEGYVTYVTQDQLKTDNLNNTNGAHDIVLGLAKTSSSGVTNYEDQRVLVASNAGESAFRTSKFRIKHYDDGTDLAEPIDFEFLVVK